MSRMEGRETEVGGGREEGQMERNRDRGWESGLEIARGDNGERKER